MIPRIFIVMVDVKLLRIMGAIAIQHTITRITQISPYNFARNSGETIWANILNGFRES